MSKVNSHDEREEKPGWLKRNVVPSLMLILVIAITSGILFFYQHFPDRFDHLENFGYPGAFLISLLLNATVILPVGNFLILFALGAFLPSATLVGLAGGAGAAIGEITGYMAGYSGRAIVYRKRQKMYARLEGWVKKWGVVTIFIFSLMPLFFDLVGIAAGILHFPFRKFLFACWLGRSVLYIGIAFAGAHGWEAIFRYIG